VVRAERADKVGLGGAAHPGDLGGAEDPGELHGVAADAAGGADYQHLLPGLDPPGVAQALQGREPGHREDGRLLEAERGRLADQLGLRCGGVLGERSAADSEHLVACREPGYLRPGGHDHAGHVHPGHLGLRPAEPEAKYPHKVRLAGHQVPCAAVDPGRPDAHEDLVRGDGRPGGSL